MVNISFLFGAGAEAGRKNYEMCVGADFCKRSLLSNKYENRREEIKQALRNKFEKASHNGWCQKGYRGDFIKSDDIDENTIKERYSRCLDSYFHTIINPNSRGQNNYFKVFNYYWSCYFVIVEDVLKFFSRNGKPEDKQEANSYFSNDCLDYEAVLDDIISFTNQMYGWDVNGYLNTYYGEIKKQLDEHKRDICCKGVATSNYFHFADIIGHNVIHLNGKLSSFEFPRILSVGDVYDDNVYLYDGSEQFFPFIFGQSSVKPIVHSMQIKAFKEFYDMLGITDVLVIIGYGINEDDNHINALIREFITRNNSNRILFVDKDWSDRKIDDIRKCLRINESHSLSGIKADGENNKIIEHMFEIVNSNC